MQICCKSVIFLVSRFDFFQFYPSMQINYRFKFHFGPNSFNFWFCFKLFNFININVWIYFNFVLKIKFITYVFFYPLYFESRIFFIHISYIVPISVHVYMYMLFVFLSNFPLFPMLLSFSI